MLTCRGEALLGKPLIFCITLFSKICQDPQRIFKLRFLILVTTQQRYILVSSHTCRVSYFLGSIHDNSNLTLTY